MTTALTPREREVLRLAAEGMSQRETAAALGLSVNTVRAHVASAYRKLGAGRMLDALTIAGYVHISTR